MLGLGLLMPLPINVYEQGKLSEEERGTVTRDFRELGLALCRDLILQSRVEVF